MRLITYTLSLLALLVVVSATPQAIRNPARRLTNAELLKRGLGPMPPMFKRGALPGGGLAPTKTSPLKRAPAAPSATTVTYTGRIQVKSVQGSSYGYVENTNAGIDGVNFGAPTNDLHVQFTTSSTGAGPFNILATNPNFPSPHFIGGKTTSATRLGPRLGNGVTFNNVRQSPPNTAYAGGESSIWSINPTTRQLTAQWVNPDGSKPTTHIGIDLRNNALVLTGNINLYNQQHTYPISEVQFFLAAV